MARESGPCLFGETCHRDTEAQRKTPRGKAKDEQLGKVAEATHGVGKVALLEEADGGDAGGTSAEAVGDIADGDSAEGEYGKISMVAGGGAERIESEWRSRAACLLKDGREHGEVGTVGFGATDGFGCGAGDGDEKVRR